MSAQDQQFIDQFGAKLVTDKAPFNPWEGTGSEDDSARYFKEPGFDFMRPWLAVRNGPAFQWPVGLQGFTDVISPSLAIHKYLGDSDVDADVLHAGEEHLTLTGYFPGHTAGILTRALRSVVKYPVSDEGWILYVPEITEQAWFVKIVNAEIDRQVDDRGNDCSYTIEFVKTGATGVTTGGKSGGPGGHRIAVVDSKHRTLRAIARWKLSDPAKWTLLYRKNEKWFNKHHVKYHEAPNYTLPIGLKLSY